LLGESRCVYCGHGRERNRAFRFKLRARDRSESAWRASCVRYQRPRASPPRTEAPEGWLKRIERREGEVWVGFSISGRRTRTADVCARRRRRSGRSRCLVGVRELGRHGRARAGCHGRTRRTPRAVRPWRDLRAWSDRVLRSTIRNPRRGAAIPAALKPDARWAGPSDPDATPRRHRLCADERPQAELRAVRRCAAPEPTSLICATMVQPRLNAYLRMARICNGSVCW